jgi:DNA topoisomerase-3
MENAGNLTEDEELRETIKKNGIGTPATRAPIIEKLIKNEYIAADKKTQIVKPTNLGTGIVEVVEGIIPSMLSPEMTANWGKGLTQIEKGNLDPATYRKKVEEFVVKNVEKIKENAPQGGGPREKKVVGTCPVCGSDVLETRYGWLCSAYKKDDENSCKFGIRYEIRGVKLKDEQLSKILNEGQSDILSGFVTKDGKNKYKGTIKIEDGIVKIKPLTKDDDPGLGKCPKCGEKVLTGKFGAYCTGKCGMNLGRCMGRQLTDAQIKALLDGKKITLKKLKSKAGKEYDACFTPDGIEPFNYTKKTGEEVSGYQFKFKMSFPEGKKKKKA